MNIEIKIKQITEDYLNIANVKTIDEIKLSPYGIYYQREIENLRNKKIQKVEIKQIDNKLLDDASRIFCSCKIVLAMLIEDQVLLRKDIKFSNDTIFLKILCKCGKETEYKLKEKSKEESKQLSF